MFENNVSVPLRTVYLGGEINSESSRQVIQGLYMLGSISKKPITLLINSGGGDTDDGWAMYDTIRCSRVPIHGIVLGSCQSSAMTVLQACHKRMASPSSTLMIHDGSVAISRTHMAEAASVGRQLTHDLNRLYKVFTDKTGLSLKKVRSMCAYSAYFTAEQALALHLVDSILPVNNTMPKESHGKARKRSRRSAK